MSKSKGKTKQRAATLGRKNLLSSSFSNQNSKRAEDQAKKLEENKAINHIVDGILHNRFLTPETDEEEAYFYKNILLCIIPLYNKELKRDWFENQVLIKQELNEIAEIINILMEDTVNTDEIDYLLKETYCKNDKNDKKFNFLKKASEKIADIVVTFSPEELNLIKRTLQNIHDHPNGIAAVLDEQESTLKTFQSPSDGSISITEGYPYLNIESVFTRSRAVKYMADLAPEEVLAYTSTYYELPPEAAGYIIRAIRSIRDQKYFILDRKKAQENGNCDPIWFYPTLSNIKNEKTKSEALRFLEDWADKTHALLEKEGIIEKEDTTLSLDITPAIAACSSSSTTSHEGSSSSASSEHFLYTKRNDSRPMSEIIPRPLLLGKESPQKGAKALSNNNSKNIDKILGIISGVYDPGSAEEAYVVAKTVGIDTWIEYIISQNDRLKIIFDLLPGLSDEHVKAAQQAIIKKIPEDGESIFNRCLEAIKIKEQEKAGIQIVPKLKMSNTDTNGGAHNSQRSGRRPSWLERRLTPRGSRTERDIINRHNEQNSSAVTTIIEHPPPAQQRRSRGH